MKIKLKDLNNGDSIKADIYSRDNSINGKYKIGQLGLHNLGTIRSNDLFFLETLKIKADLADKMITESEAQGKDTNNPNVMKELGEEINTQGTPIHRSEAVMTAIFVAMRILLGYLVALGIWGLVFKSLFTFCVVGLTIGLLISLFSAPVVASQRTWEKVREMSFSIGSLWSMLSVIIFIIGLIALIVRMIFYR